MSAQPEEVKTELVNLAQSHETNWIDATTCLFNVNLDSSAGKISTIIKVFSNNQVLVTLTDNGKFGSTYSAKRVSLDGPQFAQDLFGGGGMDMFSGGATNAMLDDDDIFDDDDVGMGRTMPKDTVETQLLLGDRKSQEVGELLTVNLFRMLEKVPKFDGLETMVLQVSISTLRRPAGERSQQTTEVRQLIELLKTKLTGSSSTQ